MRIAVFGASGFTGGLTVAEVVRRGLTPVLVGRNKERLRTVGGAGAEVRVAGLDDHEGLVAALRDCDAVVNCAGPFTLWGEPVVRAAIAAGTHYVDTAGEQQYIGHVLDTFGGEAERAGIAVVPAMADDGGPGDLIAHLTASRLAGIATDGLPAVSEMVIADLRKPGAASRGTARSMAAVFAQRPLDYVDGAWVEAAHEGLGAIAVPGEAGEVAVVSFALPGVVTIPRHVRAGRVRSAIRTEVAAMFSALTDDVVEGVPEIPDEAVRTGARWLMLAEAGDGEGKVARGWVTGSDGYGMTAVIAVEGARRLVESGSTKGALTPAQAFDPAGFLDHLAAEGVTWQVTMA